MPFTGKVGDTLYLKDSLDDSHLYVILTKPNENGKVVLVNFTAARPWKECIVRFKRGRDKRLFKKDTTISYKDAYLADHQKLLDEVSRRPRKAGVYCQLDIVKEIIIGAFKSKETKVKVVAELAKQYPEEHKAYYSDNIIIL